MGILLSTGSGISSIIGINMSNVNLILLIISIILYFSSIIIYISSYIIEHSITDNCCEKYKKISSLRAWSSGLYFTSTCIMAGLIYNNLLKFCTEVGIGKITNIVNNFMKEA